MELSGKVLVKEVLYKELENGAAIVVYKVVNDDPNLLFNDFYFATFDDTSSEEVVGVGYDIESALEDAERELQKELGVSILKDNKGIYSGEKEELSGKVLVKEVLYKELENGAAIVVYKVVNDDPNLLFNDFYFATFDDTSSEEVVGVGYDIESALEDAERKLQKELGVSILKDNKGSDRENLVGLGLH